jgi:hypothetical protein
LQYPGKNVSAGPTFGHELTKRPSRNQGKAGPTNHWMM